MSISRKKPGRIVIAVSVDLDEDCLYDVTLTSGDMQAHVHFHGDADMWSEFGRQLANFPRNAADCVPFEAGDNSSYHDFMILKAYCYDAMGHTALSVLMDNNADLPNECRLEFSIVAEAASINQLGRLLAGWQINQDSEIVWEARTS